MVTGTVISIERVTFIDNLVHRYSNWYKLKRAVAWLIRFKKWIMNRRTGLKLNENLSVEEIKLALLEIMKHIQKSVFSHEIDTLQRCQTLKKTSVLQKLEPSLDECGVLCVVEHLENAPISKGFKHQIILPRSRWVEPDKN